MAEVRKFYMIIILVAGVAIGLAGILGEAYTNYGETSTNINSSSFLNRAQNISSQLNTMQSSINQQPVSGGILNIFFEVGTGVYGAFVLILNLPSLMTAFVSDIGNLFGVGVIGGWFIFIVTSIIGAVLLFEFFSTVMRREV